MCSYWGCGKFIIILCNRKTARTKTTVVVYLISHKQLCRNSLHSMNKVFFKAACLLQRCLNLLYSYLISSEVHSCTMVN